MGDWNLRTVVMYVSSHLRVSHHKVHIFMMAVDRLKQSDRLLKIL